LVHRSLCLTPSLHSPYFLYASYCTVRFIDAFSYVSLDLFNKNMSNLPHSFYSHSLTRLVVERNNNISHVGKMLSHVTNITISTVSKHRIGRERVARLPFCTCPCYCINFCIYATFRSPPCTSKTMMVLRDMTPSVTCLRMAAVSFFRAEDGGSKLLRTFHN
jgi:hypothetical protein